MSSNVSIGPQINPSQGHYFQQNKNMGSVSQPPFVGQNIGVGSYIPSTQGQSQSGPQVQGGVPPYVKN